MDSNLINIDDLVKQRLSGGEERERPGAWSRMQELLEQEEKKKPFGMIFWRRAMSTVGVLVMLALLAGGGYKVTTAFRGASNPGIAGNELPADNGGGSAAHSIAAAPQDANTTHSADVASAADESTTNEPAKEVNTPTAATASTAATNSKGAAASNTAAPVTGSAATTTTKGNPQQNVTTTGADKSTVTAADKGIKAGRPVAAPTFTAAKNNDATKIAKLDVATTPTASTHNDVTLSNVPASVSVKTNATTTLEESKVIRNANKAARKEVPMGNVSAGVPTVNTDKATAAKTNAGTIETTSTATTNKEKSGRVTAAKKNAVTTEATANTASVNEIPSVANETVATTQKANTSTARKHTRGSKGNKTAASATAVVTKTADADKTELSSDNTTHVSKAASVAKTTGGGKKVKSTSGKTYGAIHKSATDASGIAKESTEVNATPSAAAKANGASMSELPLSSSVPAATSSVKRSKQSMSAAHPVTGAAKHGVTGMATKDADVSLAADNSASTANNVSVPATGKPLALSAKASATTKKTVQKIKVQQNTIGAYPGRVQMHNDTISNDMVTVETEEEGTDEGTTTSLQGALPSPANNKKANSSTGKIAKTNNPAPAKTNGTAARNAATNTSSAGSSSAASIAMKTAPAAPAAPKATQPSLLSRVKVIAPKQELPPFAAPAPRSFNMPKQTPQDPAETEGNGLVADKKKSMYFLQSLVTAFNDVKYKFGHAKFAPGLTAGIDGTFFGPNSCKGFQFGMTANFELDEKWSFMSELKYFHRMNNTFAIKVSYDNYTYQQTGLHAGMYEKDPTDVNYTFSTLHSFELPVSLRYTPGKLGFFGGLNFLYTLPVNISREQIRQPGAKLSYVNEVGPNNTASILSSDFEKRFGIGYLLGVSYKIAPNMNIDFRNVQTIWDNAKGDASKTVSGQLFKSPSLQFSLFYRFGHKDDEQ